MTERYFIDEREKSWQDFESLLLSPEREFAKSAHRFPAMLRSLSGDLNTARASSFNPMLIDRLNRLAFDGNQRLYAQKDFSLKPIADFWIKTFPRAVRAHIRSFAACAFIFYGTALFFAVLCVSDPDAVDAILGAKSMADLESMYDKNASHYLMPRDVSTDADMFGFYIYNNVSITFRTFAGGIIAGVGSLVVLILNAVTLGSSAAHIINRDFAQTFFSFISGHAAFELTGIVLGAQAGLLLGYNFFLPRGRSRVAALRDAGRTVFPIIAGAAALDFFAAVIEAFWSSKHAVPPVVHYIFGLVMLILLVVYFIFAGREKTVKLRGAS